MGRNNGFGPLTSIKVVAWVVPDFVVSIARMKCRRLDFLRKKAVALPRNYLM